MKIGWLRWAVHIAHVGKTNAVTNLLATRLKTAEMLRTKSIKSDVTERVVKTGGVRKCLRIVSNGGRGGGELLDSRNFKDGKLE